MELNQCIDMCDHVSPNMLLCVVMMVGVAVSNTNEINAVSKGVKPATLMKI